MNRYSTLAYLKRNEQVETVNKVIVNGLKKRLDDAKCKWVDELPHVLWTYQTTPCRSRPGGILGHRSLSPICKKLTQAFLLVQGHFLSFFL